jgi:transcription elongation factor Elf1
MTDDAATLDPRIAERERVSALLKQELRGFRCLVCGHDEFVELDMPELALQPNLMLYEGDDPIAKKHVPLLAIACTRCGRIEQFAEQPLLQRVRAQGHVEGGEDR